jgi:hypothetical protein
VFLYGREPNDMEIACEMDFAETWVQELKIIYQQVSSWEETLFA